MGAMWPLGVKLWALGPNPGVASSIALLLLLPEPLDSPSLPPPASGADGTEGACGQSTSLEPCGVVHCISICRRLA